MFKCCNLKAINDLNICQTSVMKYFAVEKQQNCKIPGKIVVGKRVERLERYPSGWREGWQAGGPASGQCPPVLREPSCVPGLGTRAPGGRGAVSWGAHNEHRLTGQLTLCSEVGL